MRKIKVRAWDADNEVMVYSDKASQDNDYAVDYMFGFDEDGDGCVKAWHQVTVTPSDPMEPPYSDIDLIGPVMQFTGLQDKNGVDIYEGDVVEYKHFASSSKPLRRGRVVLHKACWCIHQPDNRYQPYCPLVFNEDTCFAEKKLKVIHDNPELLEAKASESETDTDAQNSSD